MIRSAVIVGVVTFVYFFVTSVAMPLCSPCEAVLLGLLAGFLAAVFDKPQSPNTALVRGGLTALIASILGLIGGIAGYLIRVYVVFPPEATNAVVDQLLGTEPSEWEGATDVISTVLSLGCCSVTDLVLMSAFGVLGGFAWFRWKGKPAAAGRPSPESS
jgi:hypothetical protein